MKHKKTSEVPPPCRASNFECLAEGNSYKTSEFWQNSEVLSFGKGKIASCNAL